MGHSKTIWAYIDYLAIAGPTLLMLYEEDAVSW